MAVPKKALIIGAGATTVVGGGIGAYCLLPNTTIKEELISKRFELLKTDTEYEVAFKELKSNSDFINELKKNTPDIANTSELSKGRLALKAWCDANLALNLTKDNQTNIVPKVINYCVKLPTTIKAKYEKAGKQLISNWTTKLAALKDEITKQTAGKDDALVSDLGVSNDDGLAGEGVSNKLQKWCTDNIETKLNNTKSDEIWNKVEKRCLEPKKIN